MYDACYICYGNVARSQIAEAFHRHFDPSARVISAGRSNYCVQVYGSTIPTVIRKVMAEEGISMEGHMVKVATVDMIDEAKIIPVLCKKERCLEFVANSEKAIFWNVEDPYLRDENKVREIRDIIKEKVLSLL